MRKLKFFHQTKKRCNALVATIISLNILFIGISRFAYIIVDKLFDSRGDYLGFDWLSTVFWNIGIEIFTINIGFFIYYGTLFMQENVVILFRRVAFLLVVIGFFFLSWIFFDDVGVTNSTEIILSLISGLLIGKIAYEMYKLVLAYMSGLRLALKEALDAIIHGIPQKYLDRTQVNAYDEEIIWPILKLTNDEVP